MLSRAPPQPRPATSDGAARLYEEARALHLARDDTDAVELPPSAADAAAAAAADADSADGAVAAARRQLAARPLAQQLEAVQEPSAHEPLSDALLAALAK